MSSDKIMRSVEALCAKDGVAFTSKRRDVLSLMLKESKALSAYEIADLLRKKSKSFLPAMSVYRILDFFEGKKLVHKILSMNKYTVCSHITCEHEHTMPRIVVCSKCLKSKEFMSESSITKEVKEDLESIDFHLESKHLELIGICSNCSRHKA